MVNKLYYNTVCSQTFSTCGKYLIAGNVYGDISIFDLDKVLSPTDRPTTEFRKPAHTFTAHKDIPISSLTTTDKFLIIGTVNEISGWNLKSVITSNTVKPSWNIQIPSSKDSLDVDVNTLWYNSQDERLYAGCGDNKIHVISLEDGRILHSLSGHTDYIHQISGLGNQVASASEDGSVKLWDIRQKESVNEIVPYKKDTLARSEIGKWVGAVSLSEDWILCGGGPRLSLWHLRSLDVSTIFAIPDNGIHVAHFLEENIIAGGAAKHVYQLSYGGDVVAEIPVSPTTVYSIVNQTSPYKIMSIAGSSNHLDICTNFSFKDQILAFQ